MKQCPGPSFPGRLGLGQGVSAWKEPHQQGHSFLTSTAGGTHRAQFCKPSTSA